MRSRHLEERAREDLLRKVAFVAGPSQVGKTALARTVLGPLHTASRGAGTPPGYRVGRPGGRLRRGAAAG